MPTQAVRVQKKGQVTIPLEYRQKFNLKQGDLVTFVETKKGLLLKPAELVRSETLDEIEAALREKGINLEDILKEKKNTQGKKS
jgi:AbrB family looped-hinge helix DNA binding protein